jgi:uncharacterized membrane protein YdjX (TVP38/TMEM64 family)
MLSRALPVAVIAVLVLLAIFLRPEAELLLGELGEHRAAIVDWVGRHFVLAVLAFGALYLVTKTLFLPTGPVLTAAGGLLLGTVVASVVGSIAGLLAASILYTVAEFGLGRGLRARAFPLVERLGLGFRRYGFSYIVTLRLLPVVPFWAGCIVPAVLGVPFGTYLLATLVGSFPSIFLYASLGQGLGAVLDRGDASLAALSHPGVVAPLLGLAALSLAPVLWSKLRARGASGPTGS